MLEAQSPFQMSDVVYSIDEDPSDVVNDVIGRVQRGERKLLKKGDAKIAKRCFRRAREKNVKVLSAIHIEYGLNKEEIKQFVGRDMEAINDDLMKLTKKMGVAHIEQQEFNEAEISRGTLMDIEKIKTNLQSFEDLLRGIEEGEAMIEHE